jgi:flagellar basal-body rod modification protein FlgD
MATISNVSQVKKYDPAAAAAAATVPDPTSTKDMTQNFLKMLTAQLQNQDPLNPMDSAGMTTQLAQLNMVDGINKMNTSMTNMLNQIQSTDFINMSATIGKTAMIPGNSLDFFGNSVTVGVNLPSDASDVQATVTDSTGAVVTQTVLGALQQGQNDFSWPGLDSTGKQLPSGTYHLSFTATSADGKALTPVAYTSARVASIGKSGTNTMVTLADGRTVKSTDISEWVA